MDFDRRKEKPKEKGRPSQFSRIQIILVAAIVVVLIFLLAQSVVVFAPAPTIDVASDTVSIAVTGENLLDNSSFERDPSDSWVINARNTDMVADWTDEEALTGEYSLRLISSISANQGHPGWFQTLAIEQGLTYIFTANAYSPDGASAWLAIDLLDVDGTFVRGYSSGCSQAQSDWHTKQVRVTPAQYQEVNAVSMRLGLLQCLNFSEGTTTTLYIDDVSLITE